MSNFKLSLGEMTLYGRTLTERSGAGAFAQALPIAGRAVQDSWSGEVLRVRDFKLGTEDSAAVPLWFMYPGLIGIDTATGELVICYGQGRLTDGSGPLPMLPVAELVGDLSAFCEWGVYADSRGAAKARFEDLPEAAIPATPIQNVSAARITVQLGDAEATAVLLEDSAPLTCRALVRRLPLVGTGTNTIFSGPLVRFWNANGGPNGETPLEERDGQYQPTLLSQPHTRTRAGRGMTVCGERTQEILYPGYLYYLPRRPWRGIRIAAGDPTRMGGGHLVPFAKLNGDWADFRAIAATLTDAGAQPMRFSQQA